MANGNKSLYADGAVVVRQDIAAAAVSRGHRVGTLREANGEIETLRAINAHLVKQVTDLKQSVVNAQSLADRDGLTGLFNRRKMGELLDAALLEAARDGYQLGLLFIDLDGFKAVNDKLGHVTGDKLLTTVAARISARTRAGDFVCRYGGDEFVVILPHLSDSDSLRLVAEGIARRVALPIHIDGMELQVSASIGSAVYPDTAVTADELMQRADESMYSIKSEGKKAARSHDPVPTRRREDRSKHWQSVDAW